MRLFYYADVSIAALKVTDVPVTLFNDAVKMKASLVTVRDPI
jgi:hypothetical protein